VLAAWTSARTVRVAAAVAALAVAGCSGSPSPKTAAVNAGPSGPCRSDALAQHAGVAAGAVDTYVWKPYRAGTMKIGAAKQKQVLALAAAASTRAAQELAAVTDVQGCATSLSLSSALTTGRSLATAVSKQLRSGTVNPAALGGLNSAVSLVVRQARETGATVTLAAPTTAELTAG
jgi:hypothetical protein